MQPLPSIPSFGPLPGPGVDADSRALLAEAQRGGAQAMYQVGLGYWSGTGGFPLDRYEADAWLTMAAEAGHPEAMAWLSQAYRLGLGRPCDRVAAERWARRARVAAGWSLAPRRLSPATPQKGGADAVLLGPWGLLAALVGGLLMMLD